MTEPTNPTDIAALIAYLDQDISLVRARKQPCTDDTARLTVGKMEEIRAALREAETLRARVAALAVAARPFAEYAEQLKNGPTPEGGYRGYADWFPLLRLLGGGTTETGLTLGHCRALAKLLAPASGDVKQSPMKGIDAKYGEITAEKKEFHPGEPLFVLRAQDRHAPSTLLDYAERCENTTPPEHVKAIREIAKRMREWQNANPELVKLPD